MHVLGLRLRHLVLVPLALSPLFAFSCGDDGSSVSSGPPDAGEASTPPVPPPPDGGLRDSGSPIPDAGKDGGRGNAAAGIYVADTFNNRLVYMTDITGAGWTTLGTLAASGGDAAAPGAFSGPRDVLVSSAGYIYVADSNNGRIVRMDDMTGAGWTTFGTSGKGVNELDGPFGVTVDAQERIYIADLGNTRVVRIDDMTGAGWTTFGMPYMDGGSFQMDAVERVAVTPDGSKIYVTDSSAVHIARFDSNGTNWETFGMSGTGAGHFSDPFAISLDNEGNLLIGDVGNVRLTKIAFGANNGTEYNWNGGGTVDGVSASGGKIYFSDMAKSRLVRIDDLSGTNPMIFGSKGTGTNQFDRPQGIFVK